MTSPAPRVIPAGGGQVLLEIARASIERSLGISDRDVSTNDAWLHEPGACFVTLTLVDEPVHSSACSSAHKRAQRSDDAAGESAPEGRLRGCIGSLRAHRRLADDVAANATQAAFHDPRFAPLRVDEYPMIGVEVSVLSTPEQLDAPTEADALSMLRPDIDGVIIEDGPYRATYLPQVWSQLPSPDDFLASLRRKAGLAPDHWGPHTTIWRYQVEAVQDGPR